MSDIFVTVSQTHLLTGSLNTMRWNRLEGRDTKPSDSVGLATELVWDNQLKQGGRMGKLWMARTRDEGW